MAAPRKYAMTRLAAGDYLLPSNDGRTLWRLERYEDGAAHGLVVGYQLRPFWRVSSTPMPGNGYVDVAYLEQYRWTEHAQWLPTRAAAVAVMEDAQPAVDLEQISERPKPAG